MGFDRILVWQLSGLPGKFLPPCIASLTDTIYTLVSDIKERICNYLESKYLGHAYFEDTINIANFVDPRFKAQHLNDEELSLIKQHVIRKGVELMGSGSIDEDMHAVKIFNYLRLRVVKVAFHKAKDAN